MLYWIWCPSMEQRRVFPLFRSPCGIVYFTNSLYSVVGGGGRWPVPDKNLPILPTRLFDKKRERKKYTSNLTANIRQILSQIKSRIEKHGGGGRREENREGFRAAGTVKKKRNSANLYVTTFQFPARNRYKQVR